MCFTVTKNDDFGEGQSKIFDLSTGDYMLEEMLVSSRIRRVRGVSDDFTETKERERGGDFVSEKLEVDLAEGDWSVRKYRHRFSG